MAIPTAELQGYQRVKERVEAALERCQESEDIEFKQSSSWEDIQWKVVHTALAMANLRDGGIIIVGVSEADDLWEVTGIDAKHLETYDTDVVISTINKYASPFVDVDVVLVHHHGKDFLAINVREFRDTPIVCKRSRDGTSLRKGCVYIRTPGLAQTTKVLDAREMHDLLELAAEKRARRFVETAKRVGYQPSPEDADRFSKELEGL